MQGASTQVVADSKAGSDIVDVYQSTADFAWRSLQRLGVPSADIEDVLQEVYVVVHRRLPEFQHQSKITTWIFGICLRVAARHRRRAYFRREQRVSSVPEASHDETPEDLAERHQRQRALEAILEALSAEQRAVFVMFEIEGMSCQQIADLMGVPLGTVYSRLHKARAQVKKRAERLRPNSRHKEAT